MYSDVHTLRLCVFIRLLHTRNTRKSLGASATGSVSTQLILIEWRVTSCWLVCFRNGNKANTAWWLAISYCSAGHGIDPSDPFISICYEEVFEHGGSRFVWVNKATLFHVHPSRNTPSVNYWGTRHKGYYKYLLHCSVMLGVFGRRDWISYLESRLVDEGSCIFDLQ